MYPHKHCIISFINYRLPKSRFLMLKVSFELMILTRNITKLLLGCWGTIFHAHRLYRALPPAVAAASPILSPLISVETLS